MNVWSGGLGHRARSAVGQTRSEERRYDLPGIAVPHAPPDHTSTNHFRMSCGWTHVSCLTWIRPSLHATKLRPALQSVQDITLLYVTKRNRPLCHVPFVTFSPLITFFTNYLRAPSGSTHLSYMTWICPSSYAPKLRPQPQFVQDITSLCVTERNRPLCHAPSLCHVRVPPVGIAVHRKPR